MDCLDRGFENFKTSAYRLEVLPEYAIYDTNEYDEYSKYIHHEPISGFANQNWLDDLRNWNSSNKSIKRIRVIPKKITEYFKYEFFWCYPQNILNGEEILFIPTSIYSNLSKKYAIQNDFWIFDKECVIELNYNSKFEYIGCTQIDDFLSYVNFIEETTKYAITYEQVKEQGMKNDCD